jgi:SAM-dependent methyltransferase
MRQENIKRFNDYTNVDLGDAYYLVYMPLIRDLIHSITTYSKGRVMDIGCGNKPYEKIFENCTEYLGCDIVQSNENKVDILCEATKIPVDSNSFDTVFCTQVIEHVEDHNGLLSEAFRVLKPNGHIIVSGPMYWHLHEEPHDFFRFTKYGFKYILEKSGFEVVEILANGGKWATLGQMIIHTFPHFLVKRRIFRKFINFTFHKLDKRQYDDFNTMNYVVVAKKPEV